MQEIIEQIGIVLNELVYAVVEQMDSITRETVTSELNQLLDMIEELKGE